MEFLSHLSDRVTHAVERNFQFAMNNFLATFSQNETLRILYCLLSFFLMVTNDGIYLTTMLDKNRCFLLEFSSKTVFNDIEYCLYANSVTNEYLPIKVLRAPLRNLNAVLTSISTENIFFLLFDLCSSQKLFFVQ